MSQLLELDPVLVNPLRRPQPESSQRRPQSAASVKARPVVVRTAIAIVLGTICFTCAGRIAGFAMEPVAATMSTGQEIRGLERLIERETAANEQLKADIAYLKTPAGVEQEARQRGWVMPGEVALAIVTSENGNVKMAADTTPPDGGATNTTRRDQPVAGRIQKAIDTCLAVFGRQPRP